MKRAGKTFSCTRFFIHLLFNKETKKLYHSERTDPSVITLLMANIVWGILILQNYIDFQSWEKRRCTRKLLLNLIQTRKNNMIYQIKLTDPLNLKKFKICIKVISRLELKFFYRYLYFGSPCIIFGAHSKASFVSCFLAHKNSIEVRAVPQSSKKWK